jgi:hypothetical protein
MGAGSQKVISRQKQQKSAKLQKQNREKKC